MTAFRSCALLATILITLPGTSGTADAGSSPHRTSSISAQVDRYVQPLVEMRDFSGVVLVARAGHVLVRRAYGLASQELQVAATPRTVYGIGSVSKTFTAAAIILLAQQGKLSLDDPVAKFLPDFRPGDPITIKQLLAHESGLQDYFNFPEYSAHRAEPVALDAFVALARTRPLDFPPGTKSSYSGSGYKVLAYLIERISGEPYSSFVSRNLFAPLHMEHSGDLTDHVLVEGLAPGYDPGFPPQRLQPAAYESRTWLEGNGSLYATADDLYRWAEATRGDAPVHWSRLGYPYGWGKRNRFGRDSIEQSGRIAIGYVSYLAIYPKDDVVVVVLSNIQAAVAEQMGIDLAAMVFGGHYDAPKKRPGTSAIRRADDTELSAYAGRYDFGGGFAVTVKAENGGLWVAGPEGAFLVLDEEQPPVFFFRPLYVTITFERDAAGHVTGLNWGGQMRARKVP
ncbi:MAG TPA: serine hydrolase [Thermoanaerobaculia bacterium]|jgi:CubicO group peptidase (beta-lactamase class C family)|nr:serine hydrolase [Thermoanaerobaculia bacterium]